jgi:IS605 OrfB family transposase
VAVVAVPGFVEGINGDVEQLMRKFGNCRRRAYVMNQKGEDRLEILKQLHRETGLPVRYVYTAYDTIKALPSHVTFGGLKLQRLRETGQISREEYHARRNSMLACRGDRSREGNLCLRIEDNSSRLRICIGPHQWIHVPLFIPEKYRKRYQALLDGSKPYTTILRRRLDRHGYDTKIIIPIESLATPLEPKRVMALDINSGHVDFAVAEKTSLKPVVFGKVNCSELVNAGHGKKEILTQKLVNKVGNIAKHYGAEVVAGKLRTLHCKGRRRMNRKTQGMNQFRMRQVLRYKLPLRGIRYRDMSEAYTTQVGRSLSRPLGVDMHKAAAYAFSVKVIDYPSFTFLRSVHANEDDGSLSMRLNGGSELTAPRQATHLTCNDSHARTCEEATPNLLGKGGLKPNQFQTHILQVRV